MPLRYPRPSALGQLGPGHNVVESSASTGKTFLLEHLFVDLILSRGLSIKQAKVHASSAKACARGLAWLAEAVAAHLDDALGLLGVRWGRSDLVETLAYLQERLPLSENANLANLAKATAALKATAVPLEAAVVSTPLPRLRERAAADKRRAGR
jgi:hypothetical protein